MTERFTIEWVYPDHAGMGVQSIKDNNTNEIVDLELSSVFQKLVEVIVKRDVTYIDNWNIFNHIY